MLSVILIFIVLLIIYILAIRVGINIGFSIVVKMIAASPQDWKFVVEMLEKDEISEEEAILLRRCIKHSATKYMQKLKE